MPVLRARVIVGDIQVNMTCHIQRSHAKIRLTQKLDENMSNCKLLLCSEYNSYWSLKGAWPLICPSRSTLLVDKQTNYINQY